jgi:hypothetical protein
MTAGSSSTNLFVTSLRARTCLPWKFEGAIRKLREVFGIDIAKIAVAYGIDIEEDLASIISEEDTG